MTILTIGADRYRISVVGGGKGPTQGRRFRSWFEGGVRTPAHWWTDAPGEPSDSTGIELLRASCGNFWDNGSGAWVCQVHSKATLR